jgi:Dolichyl-phosphate-mannose-protein mannosyltransferase
MAIALCLGYPACRNTVRGPVAPVIALLMGVALFSLAVCLLSWVRIFTGVAIALLGVTAGALTVLCLWRDVPRWRQRFRTIPLPGPVTITSFTILVLVLVGFSYLTLYPSTAFDAPSYHLPLARDLVRQHGLVYDPFVRYSFFPQANEAMFAVMMLLTPNAVAAAALEYAILALAVLALPLWFIGSGRRVGAGFLAGILVLASPVVIFAGTAALVDVWTLTFVLGGTLIGLEAAERRTPAFASLLLAGALFGEAAATKYTGALFSLAAVVAVVVAAGGSRAMWRALPGVLAGGVVIAAPWYSWTIHITGDPVYPFLTGIFGNRHGLWTPLEVKLQSQSESSAGYNPGVFRVLKRDLQFLRGNVNYETGIHRSPLSWLLILGVIRLVLPSGWRDRTFLGVALAAVLSVLISLNLSANPRYLVPAVGFFALGAGLTAEAAIAAGKRWAGDWLTRAALAPAWCLVCVVIGLWTSFAYAHWVRRNNGAPPTSPSAIYAYLAPRVPCYGAAKYLNHVGGKTYRAWGYSCEQAHFYADGRLISDAFSEGSRPRIFDDDGTAMPSAQVLWQRLEPLHVAWMILPTKTAPDPSALEAHGLFHYVTTVGPEEIFRVAPRSGSSAQR